MIVFDFCQNSLIGWKNSWKFGIWEFVKPCGEQQLIFEEISFLKNYFWNLLDEEDRLLLKLFGWFWSLAMASLLDFFKLRHLLSALSTDSAGEDVFSAMEDLCWILPNIFWDIYVPNCWVDLSYPWIFLVLKLQTSEWSEKIRVKSSSKVRSFLEHSCAILSSFKIVVIFNITSAEIKISWCIIENDHNFERTEDLTTVF